MLKTYLFLDISLKICFAGIIFLLYLSERKRKITTTIQKTKLQIEEFELYLYRIYDKEYVKIILDDYLVSKYPFIISNQQYLNSFLKDTIRERTIQDKKYDYDYLVTLKENIKEEFINFSNKCKLCFIKKFIIKRTINFIDEIDEILKKEEIDLVKTKEVVESWYLKIVSSYIQIPKEAIDLLKKYYYCVRDIIDSKLIIEDLYKEPLKNHCKENLELTLSDLYQHNKILYGKSGSGKTYFIEQEMLNIVSSQLLKRESNFKIIYFSYYFKEEYLPKIFKNFEKSGIKYKFIDVTKNTYTAEEILNLEETIIFLDTSSLIINNVSINYEYNDFVNKLVCSKKDIKTYFYLDDFTYFLEKYPKTFKNILDVYDLKEYNQYINITINSFEKFEKIITYKNTNILFFGGDAYYHNSNSTIVDIDKILRFEHERSNDKFYKYKDNYYMIKGNYEIVSMFKLMDKYMNKNKKEKYKNKILIG